MCCGWSPFYADDTQQMYKNIAFGKVRFPKDTLSSEGKSFVKGVCFLPGTRLILASQSQSETSSWRQRGCPGAQSSSLLQRNKLGRSSQKRNTTTFQTSAQIRKRCLQFRPSTCPPLPFTTCLTFVYRSLRTYPLKSSNTNLINNRPPPCPPLFKRISEGSPSSMTPS
jgi:hypothetical protein